MVEKPYRWAAGATLEEHSKRKHKILHEYFARYMAVRCQLPQQERFRLAIVEGFAGAGRYSCGTAGSPVIFIEELRAATESFNLKRVSQGLGSLAIECLLVFNDSKPDTIELLKGNMQPLLAAAKDATLKLHVRIEYLTKPFEEAYPAIKQLLQQGRYRNVLFNLDQCGHSHVERKTLVDIMHSFASAEIFYTFAIEPLLAFLRKSEPQLVAAQLGYLGFDTADLGALAGRMNKNAWLGAAERLVFEAFRNCAPFVSPFSINNPDGWRYWLIHFAKLTHTGRGKNTTTSCTRIAVRRRISAAPVFTCCLTTPPTIAGRFICSICPAVTQQRISSRKTYRGWCLSLATLSASATCTKIFTI